MISKIIHQSIFLIILIIIGYYDNKNKSAAIFWGWTHFQGTINNMIVLNLATSDILKCIMSSIHVEFHFECYMFLCC